MPEPTPEGDVAEIAGRRGIPNDLLLSACEAAYGTPLTFTDDFRSMANALAAVLPAHQAAVRERVAQQVMALIDRERRSVADEPPAIVDIETLDYVRRVILRGEA